MLLAILRHYWRRGFGICTSNAAGNASQALWRVATGRPVYSSAVVGSDGSVYFGQNRDLKASTTAQSTYYAVKDGEVDCWEPYRNIELPPHRLLRTLAAIRPNVG